MPPTREEPSWTKPACLRIGKVLLDAPDRTFTASQITAAGGGNNVARTAMRMVEAGMLMECLPPEREKGTPGRRSDKAFYLPDDQVPLVEAHLQRAGPGLVDAGQQVVFAEASRLPDVFEALEVSAALPKAAWYALYDGEPQEYAFAFVGDEAVNASHDLIAELRGAGIAARRASVTQVGTPDGLAFQARRSATAARKARMRAASQTKE